MPHGDHAGMCRLHHLAALGVAFALMAACAWRGGSAGAIATVPKAAESRQRILVFTRTTGFRHDPIPGHDEALYADPVHRANLLRGLRYVTRQAEGC